MGVSKTRLHGSSRSGATCSSLEGSCEINASAECPPLPSDVTKREDALDWVVVTTGAGTSMSRQRRKALRGRRESTSPHAAIFHHRPPPGPLNRRAGGVGFGGDQVTYQAGDHQSRPLTATHHQARWGVRSESKFRPRVMLPKMRTEPDGAAEIRSLRVTAYDTL